mmetsp:Transcript_7996/g.17362  ORF Transcript_7996/g.17362 Transcript_7996/m.17362 type:complete len:239 (+) Transcript_7996:429-1145(+)
MSTVHTTTPSQSPPRRHLTQSRRSQATTATHDNVGPIPVKRGTCSSERIRNAVCPEITVFLESGMDDHLDSEVSSRVGVYKNCRSILREPSYHSTKSAKRRFSNRISRKQRSATKSAKRRCPKSDENSRNWSCSPEDLSEEKKRVELLKVNSGWSKKYHGASMHTKNVQVDEARNTYMHIPNELERELECTLDGEYWAIAKGRTSHRKKQMVLFSPLCAKNVVQEVLLRIHTRQESSS